MIEFVSCPVSAIFVSVKFLGVREIASDGSSRSMFVYMIFVLSDSFHYGAEFSDFRISRGYAGHEESCCAHTIFEHDKMTDMMRHVSSRVVDDDKIANKREFCWRE